VFFSSRPNRGGVPLTVPPGSQSSDGIFAVSTRSETASSDRDERCFEPCDRVFGRWRRASVIVSTTFLPVDTAAEAAIIGNQVVTYSSSDPFRALADPTRRAVLEHLLARPHSVNELVDHFDVTRPAISKHLRILKGARVVRERRDG